MENTKPDIRNHLTACHNCDLLVNLTNIQRGHRFRCPRCGTVLLDVKKPKIDAILALSLTALILYIPANILPIMTLNILGKSNANTMIGGVAQLFHDGYWWMSFLVFFCSMLAPLLRIIFLLLISIFYLASHSQGLIILLDLHKRIIEWAMLDVYMIGILVSFIKIMSLGHLVSGIGLYCFIGLMVSVIWAYVLFDENIIWERVSRRV